jgi:hypothetical protein
VPLLLAGCFSLVSLVSSIRATRTLFWPRSTCGRATAVSNL